MSDYNLWNQLQLIVKVAICVTNPKSTTNPIDWQLIINQQLSVTSSPGCTDSSNCARVQPATTGYNF